MWLYTESGYLKILRKKKERRAKYKLQPILGLFDLSGAFPSASMTFGSDLPLLQWRAEFSSLAETVYSSQKPVFVLKPSHPRWGWIQTTLQSGHLRWNPAYLANTEHGLWKQISHLKCKHHVDGLCPTLLWVQWTGIKLIYLLLLLCDSLAVQTSCEFKGPPEMYLTQV